MVPITISRLAEIAYEKLNQEAARSESNLRLLIAHADLLDGETNPLPVWRLYTNYRQ